MITCMQAAEKEKNNLFKSGQIIQMDIIKGVISASTKLAKRANEDEKLYIAFRKINA